MISPQVAAVACLARLGRLCCKTCCKRVGKGPCQAVARELSLRRERSATTTRESLEALDLELAPARRARAPTLDAMDDC